MWQDYVFTICGIIFSYSIIPQIIKNFKLKTAKGISWQLIGSQCIGVLLSFTVLFSLKLYLSATFSFMQVLCWLVVVIQKVYYKRKLKKYE